MYAGGAVVAVGLVVFLRKRQAGSATSSAGIADGSSLAGTPGNPASLNSVGTDVASQLGQFGAAQQQQLGEWLSGLTTTLQSGATIPTAATTVGVVTPAAVNPPAPNPFINAGGNTISVGKGADLGLVAASIGLTTAQFQSLNKDIWQGIIAPKGRPYRIR
jgi:hypothetical protein